MEILLYSLKIVAPLFIMLAIGYALAACKIIDKTFTDKTSKFVFRFAMPVLQMYNMYNSNLLAEFDGKLVITICACVIGIIVLSWIIIPRFVHDRKKAGVMIQAAYRSNFLLFALYIMRSLFGEEALGLTTVMVAVATALFNFAAVVILAHFGGEKKMNLWKTLRNIALNPLILGTAAGIVLSLSGIKLGGIIEGVAEDIGNLVTPLMLIALGGQFTFKSAKANAKNIAACVILRLIAAPVVMLTIGILLGFRGPSLGLILAISCSPVAVSSFAMADQFGCDTALAGEAVVFTTAFSTLTIFSAVFILKYLALI